MILKILIGVLPFIMMFSVLNENLGSLVLFLIGSIFVIKNKNKIKENKYFYILEIMSLLILLSQLIISPYIESISGVFLFLNIPIYYLIYRYLIKENKDDILKYIVFSIASLSIFYIFYHGIYQGIRIFGNIGYANSYALLILIGLYLNQIREKDSYNSIIESILFLALLFTGSRTTIILSALYIIYKLYIEYRCNNTKFILSLESIGFGTILYIVMDKFKIYSILIVPILIIIYYFIKDIKFRDKLYYALGGVLVIVLFITNSSTISRLKEVSLYTGTLQERFVYYEDSIKAVLSNPLGNGINMFQYKQFETATAFYDGKYLHNSYLQIAYDAGIINSIIFITVVIIGLIIIFKSRGRNKNYLLLAYMTIMIHSVLDFDFSFSTMTILLMLLVVLGENNIETFNIKKSNNNKEKNNKNGKVKSKNLNDKNEDLENDSNINITQSSSLKVRKSIYIVLAIISIYFIIYEGSIVLGKYLIDVNSNTSNKILSFSNNISFNRDYRGYFYKAQVKKNQYDSSENEEYLKEGVKLLETSKKINPYDPMVAWNLSYLHEALGQDETALIYGEEVLARERFYPEAYIKQYDYLMKLYAETKNRNYEYKLKNLESTYYINYEELNKKAKYMNNQLQENFDDIRDKNIDYNIYLNGRYIDELKYYNQEDEKWASLPYKTNDNLLGKTGCGVTAMAMIQSTMKDREITPIEMAEYSIENGYCNNNTEVDFFHNVVKDERYKLKVEKFNGDEISKVKRLVSDGKHIAVALMRPGDFTTEGHYLVIYGVEIIDGVNYFNVLDSNKDNNNYKDNGNVIYNNPKDGIIKVKASLFLDQCIEYWIYSK